MLDQSDQRPATTSDHPRRINRFIKSIKSALLVRSYRVFVTTLAFPPYRRLGTLITKRHSFLSLSLFSSKNSKSFVFSELPHFQVASSDRYPYYARRHEKSIIQPFTLANWKCKQLPTRDHGLRLRWCSPRLQWHGGYRGRF